MPSLNDLCETRFYQEVLQEGIQKGIALSIAKLAANKYTAEEIAKVLEMEVDQVRKTIAAAQKN